MSFLDQIEKIQKKPDHARKRIAGIATAVSTGIIVLVWLTTTHPFSLGVDKTAQELGYDPFSIVKDIKDTANMAGTAINGFKEDITQVKDYAEAIKQQAEENLDSNNYGQNQ